MPEMEQGDFLRSSAEEFPLKNGERHVNTSVGVDTPAKCMFQDALMSKVCSRIIMSCVV